MPRDARDAAAYVGAMSPLVVDRACGACTACCSVIPIDAPELRKTAGVLCRHCTPSVGCAVHAAAPQVCRDFHCGWRRLPALDAAWRPDLSGLMLLFDDDDIPAGFDVRPGVKFLLIAGREAMLTRPALGWLAGLVAGRTPCFMSVRGPPDHHFAKAFLNTRLEAAVARRDGSAMIAALVDLHTLLAAGPFKRVVFASAAPRAPSTASAVPLPRCAGEDLSL